MRRVVTRPLVAGVVGAVDYGRRLNESRQRLLERARQVVGTPRLVSISLVHTDHADPDSRPYTWVHDAALLGGRLQGYGIHDLDFLHHPEDPRDVPVFHPAVPVDEFVLKFQKPT